MIQANKFQDDFHVPFKKVCSLVKSIKCQQLDIDLMKRSKRSWFSIV